MKRSQGWKERLRTTGLAALDQACFLCQLKDQKAGKISSGGGQQWGNLEHREQNQQLKKGDYWGAETLMPPPIHREKRPFQSRGGT